MKNKGYAKFWGVNKVHYVRFASGVVSQAGLYIFRFFYPKTGVLVLGHGEELIRCKTV